MKFKVVCCTLPSVKNKSELTKYLNLIIKIGVGVLTAILGGFFIGFFVNNAFDMNGLPIVIGVLVGVGLGFTWTYMEVMAIEPDE